MVSMLETKSTVVSSYGTNSIQYLLLDDAKGRITMEYDAVIRAFFSSPSHTHTTSNYYDQLHLLLLVSKWIFLTLLKYDADGQSTY